MTRHQHTQRITSYRRVNLPSRYPIAQFARQSTVGGRLPIGNPPDHIPHAVLEVITGWGNVKVKLLTAVLKVLVQLSLGVLEPHFGAYSQGRRIGLALVVRKIQADQRPVLGHKGKFTQQ
jgi:hypothetical protein